MSDTTSAGPARPADDWRQAGRSWGARATEWAYLFEPGGRSANQLLFDELAVGEGTRYLDVACGSGLAAHTAAARGAAVSGLDAAEALIHIARARTPAGDFRVGDLAALPFADDNFDVVTSFNGIWKGNDDGLRESRRVLADDGRLGLTFWGSFDRNDLLPYFLAVIEHSPPSHQHATADLGDTANVMEHMLRAAQFEIERQGAVDVINEWPDVETAVRAMASAGAAVPAIESIGYDGFCDVLRGIYAPRHEPHLGLRLCSELAWITARPR